MVAKITHHGSQIIYVVRKRLRIANTKDLRGSAFGLRSNATMENFTGVEALSHIPKPQYTQIILSHK